VRELEGGRDRDRERLRKAAAQRKRLLDELEAAVREQNQQHQASVARIVADHQAGLEQARQQIVVLQAERDASAAQLASVRDELAGTRRALEHREAGRGRRKGDHVSGDDDDDDDDDDDAGGDGGRRGRAHSALQRRLARLEEDVGAAYDKGRRDAEDEWAQRVRDADERARIAERDTRAKAEQELQDVRWRRLARVRTAHLCGVARTGAPHQGPHARGPERDHRQAQAARRRDRPAARCYRAARGRSGPARPRRA
jgi:hypothetical protein